MEDGRWVRGGRAQVVLPGRGCSEGTVWMEVLKGTTQAGCLAAPGAHTRDRYSIPHPAWISDHISRIEQVDSAGADVVLG